MTVLVARALGLDEIRLETFERRPGERDWLARASQTLTRGAIATLVSVTTVHRGEPVASLVARLREPPAHECCECPDMTPEDRPCRYCRGMESHLSLMAAAADALEETLLASSSAASSASSASSPSPDLPRAVDARAGEGA